MKIKINELEKDNNKKENEINNLIFNFIYRYYLIRS